MKGYCDNGIHHIGEADECWKCQEWERQLAAERVYWSAWKAHLLASHLGLEGDDLH